MSNADHLKIIEQGVEAWNDWRASRPLVIPDLRGAVLKSHSLERADFSWTKLQEANLSGASLDRALLDAANLEGADLSGAWLTRAIITRASLHNTEFVGAKLGDTVFAETTLDSCKGLDGCIHTGPSSIDIETLRRSGPLPLPFLRGIGLTDKLIDYLPSLFGQPIQFFSCFISYSVRDEEFARHRLYADLQNRSVRCWIAPEDMKIGAKILDTLYETIRLRNKVLLVLSKASTVSGWVEDEVNKAFAEERRRGDRSAPDPD